MQPSQDRHTGEKTQMQTALASAAKQTSLGLQGLDTAWALEGTASHTQAKQSKSSNVITQTQGDPNTSGHITKEPASSHQPHTQTLTLSRRPAAQDRAVCQLSDWSSALSFPGGMTAVPWSGLRSWWVQMAPEMREHLKLEGRNYHRGLRLW